MDDEAIELLNLALDDNRAAGDVTGEARTLKSLGLAQMRTGRLSAAEDSLKAALPLTEQVTFNRWYRRSVKSAALGGLAIVLLSKGGKN